MALALAGATAMPSQAADSDAPIRAAIILNIIRFVDFGPTTGPLVLCSSRGDSAARSVAVLNGQRAGVRSITFREADEAANGCHVIYMASATGGSAARMRRPGVLLIGNGSGFVDQGGTIALIGTGNQIRFEANTQAARAAQIKLSSKLLRLAARVR